MKRISLFLILLIFISTGLAQQPSLRLTVTNYAPGATITVYFSAPATYSENAWIGIIPSNVKHGSEAENDKHDLTYQYLKKRTSGELQFKAPQKEGHYDFRMHDTDNNGIETASVSFSVGNTAVLSANASIVLNKSNFQPGEKIHVNFTAPPGLPGDAWIGIIPSNISHGSEAENDRHDISYQYLQSKTSGTLIFTAPANEGSFDFRMNSSDNSGKELASATFTVGKMVQGGYFQGNNISLKINKTNFTSGEVIQLFFTAPSTLAENAWIGIVPSHVKHGSEALNDQHDISYQYLKNMASGTMQFNAPSQKGSFDFRIHDKDNNGKELGYISFTVE